MSWLSKSLSSSIGKKIIMALTGISLILFLTVHFINNMFLFFGKDGFDKLVSSLDAVKPIVRVAEFALVLLFGFHIYNGIKLWVENRKANHYGEIRCIDCDRHVSNPRLKPWACGETQTQARTDYPKSSVDRRPRLRCFGHDTMECES